ncbi:MAG: DsbA family oxidoreductase [Casimicrobiaceae bacterium]
MIAIESPPSIDLISDVVCPWCFVGKRRLDAALSRAGLAGATVRWHPFELNPDIPEAGMDRRAYLEAKFGDAGGANTYARVREAGAGSGIDFAFDRIVRQPNTRAAHRLVWWVQSQAQDATPLMERLFRGYFLEGRSLAGHDALLALAADAGVDAAAAGAFLASDAGAAEVRQAEQRAQEIGVSGVPFFIFAQRLAVSGAQGVDLLVDALRQASSPDPAATAART